MATSSSRDNAQDAFVRRYRAALRRHLSHRAAATESKAARRLGRDALDQGMEILELATIHEQAWNTPTMAKKSTAAQDRRARTFFAECIVPMEATHRGAVEATSHASRLKEDLAERSRELSAAKGQLTRELANGEVMAQALHTSRENSNRLLEESRRLQEELRHLSRQILFTQEEERKRISRELHDLVAQTLTGINVHLMALKKEAALNTKGLTSNIARTQKLVERSVDKVHRFARELRPALLDDLGLVPALHSFLKRYTTETGIPVILKASDRVESLSSAKRTVLYRVAQEALTNIARHANAGRASVQIRQLSTSVSMRIEDDGRSFDVEDVLHDNKARRMGLIGMRERVEMVGGTIAIESAPGKGTTITAHIPIRNPAARKTRR